MGQLIPARAELRKAPAPVSDGIITTALKKKQCLRRGSKLSKTLCSKFVRSNALHGDSYNRCTACELKLSFSRENGIGTLSERGEIKGFSIG